MKLINLTGNHDIGYSWEVLSKIFEKRILLNLVNFSFNNNALKLTQGNVGRWESVFGKTNFDFEVSGHIVAIINSMAIEKTKDSSIQDETWRHIHKLEKIRIENNRRMIVLTHIPLFKDAGSCAGDFPEFEYAKNSNLISSQTLWTNQSTQYFLKHLKPIFVFNGHDHSGCIFKHFTFDENGNVDSETTEVTLRSVMGDYKGHLGYLEISRSLSENTLWHYNYMETSFVSMQFLTTCVILFFVNIAFICVGFLVETVLFVVSKFRGN